MRVLYPLRWLVLFSLLLIVGGAVWADATPTSFEKARSAIQKALLPFNHYDRDGDGTEEIHTLARIAEKGDPYERPGTGKETVLVLVEKRLWKSQVGLPDLRPALKTYVEDLSRQGYHTFLLVSDLYAGPMHQDGLTTLALRDFLQAVHKAVPDLKGVNLVGNFPAAFMVRQYFWRREDGLAIHAGTPAEKRWDAVPHVRSIAEPVASPADIILADLDGHWDRLYRRGPERLAGLYAAFPDDPQREVTGFFQYSAERYEDFFLVQDGTWEEEYLPDGKRRFTFKGEPNTECTAADRRQTNILARPEIGVGRINAFHAGVVPNPSVKGVHGEGLLDSQGKPQAVEFGNEKSVPPGPDLWSPSERLERKLLLEYFARNHRYRRGEYRAARLPASFSTEWASSVPDMKHDIEGWKAVKTDGLDYLGGQITLADFVGWMQRPALVRAIKAHSNGLGAECGLPPDPGALESQVGAGKWNWVRQGNRLVPDLKSTGGWIGFGLMRSLYENHVLPDSPAFYFHTGCEILMPWRYETEPFSSPRHGQFQAAEALMMYGGGLALVGRGKVFYDEPREFWTVMGRGGAWGDAWARYFSVEGGDAELAKDGIGRKRAYFWSTLGDFTLTLPPDLWKPKPVQTAGRR